MVKVVENCGNAKVTCKNPLRKKTIS